MRAATRWRWSSSWTPRRALEVPSDQEGAGPGQGGQGHLEGLSYSRKQRLTLPVEDAKTPETRQRRVDKAIQTLREGKA